MFDLLWTFPAFTWKSGALFLSSRSIKVSVRSPQKDQELWWGYCTPCRLDQLTFAQPLLQSLRYLYFLLSAKSHHHMQSIYHRVSMGWWLLRLSAKILALLRLSVNLFQLRLTKKLKINFFSFKELNINKPVFFVSLSKIKVLGVSRDEISHSFETF